MAQKIKIGADISEFRKSILDLSRDLDRNLGKKGVKLFDKETMDFFAKGAAQQSEQLARKMDRLKVLAEEYGKKVRASAKGSEDELKARSKLLQVSKQLLRTEKESEAMKRAQQVLGGGGASGGSGLLSKLLGGGSGAGQIFGRIGMGGAGSGLFGRLGMLGRLGGGAALAAAPLLAAGGYAMRRGSQAYGTFVGGIGNRQRLRGMGFQRDEDLFGAPDTFRQLGMDPERLRELQLQTTGMFGRGRGGREQQGMMFQTAQFARAFGLDAQQVMGMGGGLRQQLGRERGGAAFEEMRKHAALIGESMADQVGPFLETSADMLTQLNEKGMGLDGEAMALFTGLVEKGRPIERTSRDIMNIQRAVMGATGERSAFFQSAFARQGIGGGNILGVQTAMRTGGIFGLDPEKLKGRVSDEDIQALRKMDILGEGTGFQKRAQGILDEVNTAVGQNANRVVRGQFVANQMGLQDAVQGMEVLRILEEAQQKGGMTEKKQDELRKKLEEIQKGPQEKMQDHLKNMRTSLDGQWETMKALRKEQEELLGKTIASPLIKMENAMINMDNNITKWVASQLGIETPEMKLEAGATGKKKLTEADVQQAVALDPKGAADQFGKMQIRRRELEKHLMKLEGRIETEARGGTGRGNLGYHEAIREYKRTNELLENLNSNSSNTLRAIEGGIKTKNEPKGGASQSKTKQN